ncbi:MAG: iron ABC transporter permease [Acidilobaceae archaeon]
MKNNRLGNAIRGLTYTLDLPLVMLLFFTLTLFTLILIIPLATLFLKPLSVLSLRILEDLIRYPYVSIPPLGEWYIVSDRGEYKLIIVRFKDLGVIPNTILVSSIVTLLSSIIGISIALLVARYDFLGKGILRIISIIPLLYTPFVNAFVTYKIFGDGGILGSLMLSLGLPYSIEVTYIAGTILAQTLMFWPIVYLNTLASMMQIDPSLEEQAENIGSRGFRLFRTITLPLSLPGVAAGSGLVFIFSMEDLAAPLAFKVDNMMSISIVRAITGSQSIEALSVEVVILAGLLLLSAIAWFILIKHYISLKQYAMLARGVRWKPRVSKPSLPTLLAIYLIVFPLVLFSMLPQIGVLLYAFSKSWTGVIPEGFTLEHFSNVLFDSRVLNGLKNSFIYSTLALVFIVIIGTVSSYAISRVSLRGLSAIDLLAMSPLAIPGLSIAMGLLILYGNIFKDTLIDPYINPMFLLILAYAIRKSPFTTRAVYAGLQQVHRSLEEAGFTLGASRTRVLFTIVLPLIGINIIAGSMISFVYCMSEVSTSITVGSLNKSQAPITYIIYDYLTAGYGGGAYIHQASAIVTLIIVVQLIAIITSNYILKFRYAILGI